MKMQFRPFLFMHKAEGGNWRIFFCILLYFLPILMNLQVGIFFCVFWSGEFLNFKPDFNFFAKSLAVWQFLESSCSQNFQTPYFWISFTYETWTAVQKTYNEFVKWKWRLTFSQSPPAETWPLPISNFLKFPSSPPPRCLHIPLFCGLVFKAMYLHKCPSDVSVAWLLVFYRRLATKRAAPSASRSSVTGCGRVAWCPLSADPSHTPVGMGTEWQWCTLNRPISHRDIKKGERINNEWPPPPISDTPQSRVLFCWKAPGVGFAATYRKFFG